MQTNRGVRSRDGAHRPAGVFEYYCSPVAKASATGSTLETPQPWSPCEYHVSPSARFAGTASVIPSSSVSSLWSRVSSGLNTSRVAVSHRCNIVENLLSCGEKNIAQNLINRMNGTEDGFDEIQYPELTPYVQVLGEHHTSERSEADVSILETQCATSKTGWSKNRPDAQKDAE